MTKELMNVEVGKCLEVLKSGGTLLYPTDTIWGIGCDATNEEAISKIYHLKSRADHKGMIILLDHTSRLSYYVKEVPQQAYELMELSEEPLTLVLDGAKNLAKSIISPDGSIGIRVVKDEFCRRLIERFRKPVVSTSANRSGEITPADFSQVNDGIKSGVDYIAQWRQDEHQAHKPSAILKVGLRGEIKFIRH